MDNIQLACSGLFLLSVLLSAISQVMLKKAALRYTDNRLQEYLNPLVIGAYLLLFFTTFLTILAYRGLPLSLGPVLSASGYFYVAFFGRIFFKERITRQKLTGLFLIFAGIILYSLAG